MPPKTPINTISNTTRQLPGCVKNAQTPSNSPPGAGGAGVAKNRSTPNKVNPMEPKGTSPSSTIRPDSRSHSSEPMPIPTANSVSNKVTTGSPPPKVNLL